MFFCIVKILEKLKIKYSKKKKKKKHNDDSNNTKTIC